MDTSKTAKNPKQAKNKKKQTKSSITDKQFSKEFTNNGFNSTKAYLSLKPKRSISVASAGELGYRKLKKIEVQDEIKQLLIEKGFNRAKRIEILKRNANQKQQYSASNQAIAIAEKIETGYYLQEKDKQADVVINMVIDRRDSVAKPIKEDIIP